MDRCGRRSFRTCGAQTQFVRRELDTAEKCFHAVIESRGGKDGPSKLYLAQIETARQAGPGDTPWDGTVRITEK